MCSLYKGVPKSKIDNIFPRFLHILFYLKWFRIVVGPQNWGYQNWHFSYISSEVGIKWEFFFRGHRETQRVLCRITKRPYAKFVQWRRGCVADRFMLCCNISLDRAGVGSGCICLHLPVCDRRSCDWQRDIRKWDVIELIVYIFRSVSVSIVTLLAERCQWELVAVTLLMCLRRYHGVRYYDVSEEISWSEIFWCLRGDVMGWNITLWCLRGWIMGWDITWKWQVALLGNNWDHSVSLWHWEIKVTDLIHKAIPWISLIFDWDVFIKYYW